MSLLTGWEQFARAGQPLAPYTWLKLGGVAEYFAEPTSIDQLADVVRRCREQDVRVRLLGGGSNLLVRDQGVPGMVIRLAAPAFCGVEIDDRRVTAGGGATLAGLVTAAVGAGLAGLEQLVGIPGTVGGALHGNAGGHGGDIGQWTRRATVMTALGEVLTRTSAEMHFAYRQSSLDELAIVSAEFELEREDPQQLTRRMQQVWIIQKANQPMGVSTAACIFKDPRGMSAASLIEQAGLKESRVGAAEMCDQNANFIVVGPGATSDDVLQLIELVRSQVADRLGVELENEIEIW